MREFPQKIAHFFAVLFAILFVLSLPVSTLLYNGEKYAFRAKVYKASLVEEKAYERIPEILAKNIAVHVAEDPQPSPYLKTFTIEDWVFLINEFVPPPEMRKLVETAIDQVFLYLNGKSDKASLTLVPIKAKFKGNEGVDAILHFLETKPPCTLEELEKATNPEENAIVICNPPEEALPLLKPLLHIKLLNIVSEIPDTIPLITLSTEEVKDIQNFRLFMRLSPLLPILFLLITTLLAVRSLKGWLQWWGIPALVGGILSALIGWLLPILYTAVFYTRLAPNMPKALPELVLGISLKILSFPAHAMVITGIIFFVIGGILWAVSAFIPSTEPDIL